MADRWRTIAAEYETLADALGSTLRGQTHQRPMQQQQHKTTEDDK